MIKLDFPMDFSEYKVAFIREANNIGYSEHNIQKCLNYSERLINNNFPVIFNTTHLSALVGYKKEYIKGAVQFTNSYYRDFKIKKKDGNYRVISEPLPSLKDIQLWILKNILYRIKASEFAKAYIKNKSIKQAIIFHKNQSLVLKTDLINFFGSINQFSVENIFLSLGYSKLISNLLSKLCTKDDVLPQGASTSPCLSNIYFKICDEEIGAFCVSQGIRYTRYSDDLTFSGDFIPGPLIDFVSEVVGKINLTLNPDKTFVMHKGMRQSVLGTVVNEKIQIPVESRKKIRQEMYFIKKFGFINHKEKIGLTKNNYLDNLIGRVNFQLYLNKDDIEFIKYREFLNSLKKDGLIG